MICRKCNFCVCLNLLPFLSYVFFFQTTIEMYGTHMMLALSAIAITLPSSNSQGWFTDNDDD